MTAAEQFEQLIWRIHELLENTGATVTYGRSHPRSR
jgi:hypothetical protein